MRKISKLLLALSFVVSLTSSAFAVTVASWGGAYTESQKLGYGDPTAKACLLYTSPSPRDVHLSRMPSSA